MTQHICPDCKNVFLQPFRCTTCGAQKLYDTTLRQAEQRAERAEAELAAARALMKQYRTTLRSVFFCDHNEREWPSLGVCQEWARKECERIDAELREGEAK